LSPQSGGGRGPGDKDDIYICKKYKNVIAGTLGPVDSVKFLDVI